MSQREEPQLGSVPKITPAQDEIASYKRQTKSSRLGEVPTVQGGGSSTTIKAVLSVMVLLLLATVGWAVMTQQKFQEAQLMLQQNQLRILDLENRLNVTDESMSESGVAMKVKLRELDSEVRKLWDNVWKKSRAQLASHDKQLKSQQSSISAVRKQLAEADKVIKQLNSQLAGLKIMKKNLANNDELLALLEARSEEASDTLNLMEASNARLDRRMKETEEWIDSINGFRRQVTRDLNQLKGVGGSSSP